MANVKRQAKIGFALSLAVGAFMLPLPSRAQPATTAPALGGVLPKLDLMHDLTKKTLPVVPGPWQDLIAQPYLKDVPDLKADRLLFHGQYEDAEILCNELLAKTDLPDDKRQALVETRLEAIFRQGGDVNLQRFQTAAATLTTPRMIRLRAEAMLETGKFADALAMLKAYFDSHKDLPADAYSFSVVNLYAQCLERKAQYGDAVAAYGKVAAFGEKEMPEDPAFRTEVAKAALRAAVLSDQGTGASKRARQSAQSAYSGIISLDHTYWPAQVEITRLMFETQNARDAGSSANLVLGLHPYNIEVRLMILNQLINQAAFDKAAALLKQIKSIDDVPMADALEGRLLLKQQKTDEAEERLRYALGRDPSLLEAHGWLAGLYTLRNQPEKAQQELIAFPTADRTPHPIALYDAADVLLDSRQYLAAEKLLKQASNQAGWWSAPYLALAHLYLKLGNLDQAQISYEKGFAVDDYGMTTVNQLRLLQLLKSRDVIETPHFIIRYQGAAKPDPEHPDAPPPAQVSDKVLAQLAAAWCEKIYPEVTSEYQFEPDGKTTIEMYPAHDEFAVRLTGMSQIGTFGASTGSVIALDAPRQGKDLLGNFDWARVIRHEFTHTVTLGLTNNRIPRWLTEAAAVFNEEAPRDWDNCRLLASNFRMGTLFKPDQLDAGFIFPKKPTDTGLAYAESEWIYEYLSTTYGHDKMLAFMHCFGDGKSQEECFKTVYGKTPDAVFDDFLKWAATQLAQWGLPNTVLPKLADAQAAADKAPADAPAQMTLIETLMAGNKLPDAEKLVRAQLEKTPDSVDLREKLIEILASTGKPAAATTELEKLASDAPDRPVVARLMGQAAMNDKKLDEALVWFEKLEQLRPLDETPYRSLAAIYLTRNDNKNAIIQLEKLTAHEQGDERIPRRLAQLLLEEKQLKEAQTYAFKSLRIDPYNALNHQLMAQVLLAEGQPKDAVTYLTYATDLEPETAEFWVNLADAQGAAGDKAAAAIAAKRALGLDPKSPVKNWLP